MPYAKVDDGQIYYEIDGQGDDLLLVHGIAGSLTNWAYVRPIIRKHFRVILPELRGHGRSTKLSRVTDMDIFANDLLKLLDHFKIKNCIVAGHSMGGAVAQFIALFAPERVRALILIASGHKIDAEFAQEWLRRGMELYGLTPDKAAEKSLEINYYDPEKMRNTPGMIELIRESFAQKQALELSHGYAQGAMSRFSIEDRVSEIQAPRLVIQGAQDRHFTLRFGEFLQNHIPTATLQIIDGTGHEIQFEQPEAIVNAIVEFHQSLK